MPLAISPGTPLMRQLRDALHFYAASRLDQRRLRDNVLLVSGSDVYGEVMQQ
jgi:5'-3' exonuclease